MSERSGGRWEMSAPADDNDMQTLARGLAELGQRKELEAAQLLMHTVRCILCCVYIYIYTTCYIISSIYHVLRSNYILHRCTVYYMPYDYNTITLPSYSIITVCIMLYLTSRLFILREGSEISSYVCYSRSWGFQLSKESISWDQCWITMIYCVIIYFGI